jgi:hypothetical protein
LVKLANKNNISLNSFALSTESAALWVSYNLVQIYFILPSRRQLHNGHYTALRGMKMISFDFHIVPKFKWWKILKKTFRPVMNFIAFITLPLPRYLILLLCEKLESCISPKMKVRLKLKH